MSQLLRSIYLERTNVSHRKTRKIKVGKHSNMKALHSLLTNKKGQILIEIKIC